MTSLSAFMIQKKVIAKEETIQNVIYFREKYLFKSIWVVLLSCRSSLCNLDINPYQLFKMSLIWLDFLDISVAAGGFLAGVAPLIIFTFAACVLLRYP